MKVLDMFQIKGRGTVALIERGPHTYRLSQILARESDGSRWWVYGIETGGGSMRDTAASLLLRRIGHEIDPVVGDELHLLESAPRYRYDMIGATQAGELRHPETVIRELAPDAFDFEPEPRRDCWLFRATKVGELPGYVSAAGAT